MTQPRCVRARKCVCVRGNVCEITYVCAAINPLGDASQGFHPNKPTPHSALYHTLACGICNSMPWFELLIPNNYAARFTHVVREFDDMVFLATPRTAALLLRATKGIWGSYRTVVMDSYFTGVVVLVSCCRHAIA